MSGPGDRRPALLFWRYVMSEIKYREPLEPTPLEEYLNKDGHEMPNPIPVAPPVGFKRQPSMVDHLRDMVRSELLRREVTAQGIETFEEADDFTIDDDPIDPSSPWEGEFEPTPPPEPSRTPPEGGAAASPPPPAPPVVAPPSDPPAPSVAPSKGS